MSFCIKMTPNEIFVLPSEYNLQKRIELCERLTEEYYDYFHQHSCSKSESIGSVKVCARLEAMANYILAASDNNGDYPIASEYKEKKIKNSELLFSELEEKYNFK